MTNFEALKTLDVESFAKIIFSAVKNTIDTEEEFIIRLEKEILEESIGDYIPEESEKIGDKLKLVDTEDEFSLTIGSKKIPYITKYSITSNVYGTMELDLKLTIPREIILIAD
jgi:hypothetical protein